MYTVDKNIEKNSVLGKNLFKFKKIILAKRKNLVKFEKSKNHLNISQSQKKF